jgi:S1/P1 Nuclease
MRNFAGLLAAVIIAFAAGVGPAHAWGDEGHEVIGLIADSLLEPGVREKVHAMLAADTDDLTAHDIAAAATWADKYRDSNKNGARAGTRQWHFVDIELSAPDLDRACFGHPGVPRGTPASKGPEQACVVDKINDFAAELAGPDTAPAERVVALKFVLHLVGDLHQPLHASDDNDRGGNDKHATAAGFESGTLHRYWDVEFVEQLGRDPNMVATTLIGHISARDARDWARGGPADWALETFRLAKDDAYGQLPPPTERGGYRLSSTYVAMATRDAAMQLSKAGVRLAAVLNKALR